MAASIVAAISMGIATVLLVDSGMTTRVSSPTWVLRFWINVVSGMEPVGIRSKISMVWMSSGSATPLLMLLSVDNIRS